MWVLAMSRRLVVIVSLCSFSWQFLNRADAGSGGTWSSSFLGDSWHQAASLGERRKVKIYQRYSFVYTVPCVFGARQYRLNSPLSTNVFTSRPCRRGTACKFPRQEKRKNSFPARMRMFPATTNCEPRTQPVHNTNRYSLISHLYQKYIW